jgi:outer membrane protein
MKKLFLLIPLICLLSFQPAKAQLKKGGAMVSVTSTIGLGDFGTDLMNLGLTIQKVKYDGGGDGSTYSTFGVTFLPRAGYFVIDDLAIGVDLLANFKIRKSKDSDYKYTESTLAIGPFARYYFPARKIYPFVEANAGYGTYKEKWSNDSEGENKEGLFIYGMGVGAAKPLGKKVMIDALLGYSSQTWKDEKDDKWIYGKIGLKVGITLFF